MGEVVLGGLAKGPGFVFSKVFFFFFLRVFCCSL